MEEIAPGRGEKVIETTVGDLISAIADAAVEASVAEDELELWYRLVLGEILKKQI